METEDGSKYRRNRKHVRFSQEPPMIRIDTEPDQAIGSEPDRPKTPDRVAEQPIQDSQDDVKKSRYGRPIIKPARYSLGMTIILGLVSTRCLSYSSHPQKLYA